MQPSMTISTDEAWKLFQDKAKMPVDKWRRFRKEVSHFIHEDNPNLEELGSSDFNHFAVSYIQRHDLVFTDAGWEWRNNQWEKNDDGTPREFLQRCSCGRLSRLCTSVSYGLPVHEDM